MPVPSPRNSIRVARGNFADLDANATAFGEGEFIYAIDQDRFYTSASGSLVPVGAGVVAAEGIDTLSDVDTSTIPPGVGQVLKWDGVNWIPADDNNTDAVTSVAGKTGDVTLIKADITDFSDADYATAAQGDTADTAVQPGDNVSDLTNDANYIDAAGAPIQSVNTQTGDVVLDADDIDDTLTTNKFATATQLGLADTSVQPGDNVSDLANDAGYITLAEVPSDVVTSVNTQTGDVVLDADDIDDTSTTHKFATAAQLGLADTSVQPGDNVSDLTNDANYIDASGAPVQSVNTQTGDVVLGAGDVGLGNVDNTSDANKPISTATQTALDAKADLVGGVIPTSQIPAIAITEFLGSVGSEAAMLALVGQQGDWCLRTDKAVGYVITGADPSLIANWEAFTVPGSAVTTINTQVGDVVLGAADVGAATAAQGALADSAVQPTDSIDVLADVDISTTAPTDGQALIWDNAGGKFVPGEAGLVDSVNSQTGDVVLDTDDIGEGTTNLYSQWDNATGGINYAGGNVGIGTTVPSYALEVSKSSPTFDRVAQFNSNSTVSLIAFGGSNGTGEFAPEIGQDNSTLVFNTQNQERMRIDVSGRVGIGTTDPLTTLHIKAGTPIFTIEDGSGANPSVSQSCLLRDNDNYQHQVRSNTGTFVATAYRIDFDSNGTSAHRFFTGSGAQERMRIDSSGRLLVGTSSSITSSVSQQSLLQVYSTSSSTSSVQIGNYTNGVNPAGLFFDKSRGSLGTNTILEEDDFIGSIKFNGADGTNLVRAASIDCQVDGTPGANDMPGRLVFSTTADGASSPTERMRIDSSGKVIINTSGSPVDVTSGTTDGFTSEGALTQASRNNNPPLRLRRRSSNGSIQEFFRDTSLVGSIAVTTTATAYNTSSDYRLKENVVPLANAVDRVNQLQVHRFNFIADPDTTVDGFLAHEAQAVVPECVTGTKDEVDDEGNPVYQGIDQSKIVPLLTAALQEALAKIETLEQRLTDAGL